MLSRLQVLTGTTSTLGAHLLSTLATNNLATSVRNVKKVYCLIPRKEPHDCCLPPGKSHDGVVCAPYEQVYRSLQKQDLPRNHLHWSQAIFADTSREKLDLDDDMYKKLCENVTIIIDVASIGAL